MGDWSDLEDHWDGSRLLDEVQNKGTKSMASVTGVVAKTRATMAKNNKGMVYQLCVRDGNGEENWYGFGFKDPGVTEGQGVTFEYEENGRWLNGDAASIRVEKNVPTQEQSASRNDISNAVRSTNQKERSIMTQTAYKVAAEITNGMVAAGVMKFKATTTEAGRDSAVELYMGMVHDVAQQVFNKFADPLELTADDEVESEEEGDDPYSS